MITKAYMPGTTQSNQLYKAASQLIPGGVNSPARAWARVGGNPRFIHRGHGSKIWDVDGNEFIDYVCSWGALILGHCHPEVVEAAESAVRRGSSFGAPTEIENTAAQIIVNTVPSVDMVRFVNSGTEATMSAIRLARAATGRDAVLKFDGGYHGHDDALLVKAGSGVASFGIADSAGINSRLASDTLVAPYNDAESLRQLFDAHGSKIACVIVEPIAGNMGVVPGAHDWLMELRRLTSKHGALLIFDEVISGFRASAAGAQGMYDIEPDITCLGKTIGGGYPVGAYGASAELMGVVAPLGEMYQAGTLSGNPVAMAAGVATMLEMLEPGRYDELASKTNTLAAGLSEAVKASGAICSVTSVTGMLTLFFTPTPPTNMTEAAQTDHGRFSTFFHAMLDAGIYIPPSPFEAWFISTSHSAADIEQTVSAAEGALRRVVG